MISLTKGISVNLTAFDKYISSCIHPYYHRTEQIHTRTPRVFHLCASPPRAPGTAGIIVIPCRVLLLPQRASALLFTHICPPHSLVNDSLFIVPIVLPFPKYHLTVITQFITFLERLSFFTRRCAFKFPAYILWLESSFVLLCILSHCSE